MPWSQTTEYALRAVVALAAAAPEPLTTERIARDTRIPVGYLSKVLQMLGRAGIVRSRRGLGGGFTLARAPHLTTALDIVNAVDPIRRIRSCPLGVARHGRTLCALHRRMDEALSALERVYADARLSDLIEEAERPPLCDVGASPAAGRTRPRD